MNRAALLCSLSLLSSALTPAQGRSPQQPAPAEAEHGERAAIKTDGNGFSLPAGQILITDLIDAAAHFLGRNILWNDQELKCVGGDTPFCLQKHIVVDALGCEELLYSMLFTKGLAVVPIDEQRGFFEVIALQGQRRGDIFARAPVRTREQVLRRPAFREPCVVVVPLEHLNANYATNALRPFLASFSNQNQPGLVMGTAGGTNTLLITGFGDQVGAVLRMLQLADLPQPPEANPNTFQDQLNQLNAKISELLTRVKELEGKAARN